MNRNILVTGAHRSGSTWIGRILSEAKDVKYVHEPFNIGRRSNTPFKYWNQYIDEHLNSDELSIFEKYLRGFSNFSLKATIKSILGHHDSGNLWPNFSYKTLLIKDPIAIQSSKWIAKVMNAYVIVCIRHPAAFVASLKVKNWKYDFNHILNQPEFIDKHLTQFESDIEEFATTKKPVIDQGILLWNIIHKVVQDLRDENHSDFYFITHEALSIDPMLEFENLLNFVQLPMTDKIRNKITESTESSDNSRLKRDSRKNIKSWQKRLTEDEIQQIKKETSGLWSNFYSEKDWN